VGIGVLLVPFHEMGASMKHRKKKKARLGTGKRFTSLVHSLEKRGAYDPKALAAWIGRKRYGKRKFSKLSHHTR
jgi:hypothetical protein